MDLKGEFRRSLDPKNRILMPPKIKEELGNEPVVLVCMPGERFIRVYSDTVWQEISREHLFVDDGVDRTALQRYVYRNSESFKIDSHGRFTLNSNFIEKAHIKKEIVIIGIGMRAEIWGKEELEAYEAELNAVELSATNIFPY